MSKQAYPVVFSPLPYIPSETVYYDRRSVNLPCTDDFQTLHYHDRYEVGLCEEGEGLFLFENEISYISNGNVVFIPPNKRHYSRSLNKDIPCLCRFVYIDAKTVERLITDVCKDVEKVERIILNAGMCIASVMNSADNPQSTLLLTSLVNDCKTNAPNLSALTELRLALFILEEHKNVTQVQFLSEANVKNDNIMSEVAEYISINYDRNNTVDQLVKIFNLSESQLRRRFRKVYGVSPVTYRNQLRCKIAAELLERTSISVSEISENVGYSDVSDFYRAFKKNFGTAPSVYRSKTQH